MTRKEAIHEANLYIRKIRTPHRREYAWCYLEWLLQGATGPEPRRHPDLAAMAAQGVRMALHEIMNRITS